MTAMIEEAGRQPIERDSLYHEIVRDQPARVKPSRTLTHLSVSTN